MALVQLKTRTHPKYFPRYLTNPAPAASPFHHRSWLIRRLTLGADWIVSGLLAQRD